MGDKSDEDLQLSVTHARRWPKVSKVVEEVLGAILVAIVLGLVGAWYSVRDSVAHNRDVITAHKYELKAIRDFQNIGERFTRDDADLLVQDIDALEARVHVRVAELETRCSDIGVEIARLPPPRWQERILDLERGLSAVKGNLEAKSNSIRRR